MRCMLACSGGMYNGNVFILSPFFFLLGAGGCVCSLCLLGAESAVRCW